MTLTAAPPDRPDRARRHALALGLDPDDLVPPELEAEIARERWAQWDSSLKPRNAFALWLVSQVADTAVRLERARQAEIALRCREARAAATDWDGLRRLDAEELGQKLPKSPAVIAGRLERTKHGCRWKVDRWEALGRALETKGAWTEAQRSLALDLLGVAPELRDTATPVDPEGPAPDALAARIAVVGREVARLRRLRAESLEELDDLDRAAAELGLESSAPSKVVAALRRQEGALRRWMGWALGAS